MDQAILRAHVMPYLGPRELLAFVTCSRESMSLLAYDDVFRMLGDRSVVKKLMDQVRCGKVLTPSPLRLLRVGLARRCEKCLEFRKFTMTDVGLILCDLCYGRCMIKCSQRLIGGAVLQGSIIRAALEHPRASVVAGMLYNAPMISFTEGRYGPNYTYKEACDGVDFVISNTPGAMIDTYDRYLLRSLRLKNDIIALTAMDAEKRRLEKSERRTARVESILREVERQVGFPSLRHCAFFKEMFARYERSPSLLLRHTALQKFIHDVQQVTHGIPRDLVGEAPAPSCLLQRLILRMATSMGNLGLLQNMVLSKLDWFRQGKDTWYFAGLLTCLPSNLPEMAEDDDALFCEKVPNPLLRRLSVLCEMTDLKRNNVPRNTPSDVFDDNGASFTNQCIRIAEMLEWSWNDFLRFQWGPEAIDVYRMHMARPFRLEDVRTVGVAKMLMHRRYDTACYYMRG